MSSPAPLSYDIVAFDADDTLWVSEDGFRANELRFVERVAPYAAEGIDVKAALTAVERKNLSTFGYGVKAFAISMVEAALSITQQRVPTSVIGELVDMAQNRIPALLVELGNSVSLDVLLARESEFFLDR